MSDPFIDPAAATGQRRAGADSDQPVWKLIENLGDANPLDYGGYFIFRDETGVYVEEAELLVVDNEYEIDDKLTYTVYWFGLERCTFINGILSDNKFHPEIAAWFATPEAEKVNRPQDTTYLSNVASTFGIELNALIHLFCSEDALDRAVAYRAVGEYHGLENLDSYPLKLNRAEAVSRYSNEKYRLNIA